VVASGEILVMSRRRRGADVPGFYAVARGRQTGIFTSWEQCAASVNGFPNALHQKFENRGHAELFLENNGVVVEEKEDGLNSAAPAAEFKASSFSLSSSTLPLSSATLSTAASAKERVRRLLDSIESLPVAAVTDLPAVAPSVIGVSAVVAASTEAAAPMPKKRKRLGYRQRKRRKKAQIKALELSQ